VVVEEGLEVTSLMVNNICAEDREEYTAADIEEDKGHH